MAIVTTDKLKNRKKLLKKYMIVGSIFYIYAVCFVLQLMACFRDDKRISTSDAINNALVNVFIHPTYAFPISFSTIGYILLFSAVLGVIGYNTYLGKILRKADNPDTVNGEAHLMNIEELDEYNMHFSAPLGKKENTGFNNMILSKDIMLAIDNRGTRRNCNILVIGGSGAGKSRFFAAPNILQYNANFVITDPSGEMLRDYGKALENEGYDVSVFNLTDVYKGNRYNPFHYIRSEKDVFILVNTLIKNTSPSEGHSGDPFWEKCENLLLTALILYLWHVVEPEQQTFTNVLKLLNEAEVDENDASSRSHLDDLFDDLKKKDPTNLAVRQYAKFKQGAGKTLKSILISVGVRLQSFDLKDIEYLTSTDDLDLQSFGDTKRALFVITPTADTTFSFLVSLLYSQLFASLYEYCETTAGYGYMIRNNKEVLLVKHANNKKESENAKKYCMSLMQEIKNDGVMVGYIDNSGKFISGKKDPSKDVYRLYTKKTKTYLGHRGTKEQLSAFAEEIMKMEVSQCSPRCQQHVRFILDEFANIGEIPDFDQKLATMRKYEISCAIIIQALSQLKVMYKDRWNTIVANCDTKLFLGCDDTETIEWMLKMLGKKTTAVRNVSESGNGGFNQSVNRSSIELLTIDQISMMQDSECLVRIRGVRPYYGKKFELTEHKNYKAAKALYDKFIIPVSEEALKERDACGPLRLRNQNETVQKEAQKVTSAPTNNSSTQNITKSTSKEDKVKNKARQTVAAESKELLDDDFLVSSIESFINGQNFKENPTKEDIKESIESLFVFDEFPTDEELVYTMTN